MEQVMHSKMLSFFQKESSDVMAPSSGKSFVFPYIKLYHQYQDHFKLHQSIHSCITLYMNV